MVLAFSLLSCPSNELVQASREPAERPLPKRDCKDTPFFHSTKTFSDFFMIFSNFFSRKTANRQPASNDIIYKVCRKNSVCSRKGLAFFMWKAGICASQRVPERGTELPAEKTRHETIRRDFTPAAEDITFAIDSNKSINSTIKILYDYPQKYPLSVYWGGEGKFPRICRNHYSTCFCCAHVLYRNSYRCNSFLPFKIGIMSYSGHNMSKQYI